MLQSIGALKSAIVVLSKHHSSLAQVRVFCSGIRARVQDVFFRFFHVMSGQNGRCPPWAKEFPTRESACGSLYATESSGVWKSFHWCTATCDLCCHATTCLSSSDGCTFDILAKVPSETLLNMAAVIDHQFKKHTVHPKGKFALYLLRAPYLDRKSVV